MTQAVLFLWDYAAEEKLWHDTLYLEDEAKLFASDLEWREYGARVGLP